MKRPEHFEIFAPEFDPRSTKKDFCQPKQYALKRHAVAECREIVRVNETATPTMMQAVERIAYFCDHELDWGDMAGCPEVHNQRFVAFLFFLSEQDALARYSYYARGACCFQKLSNNSHQLDWVWLHPYERNKGTLTKAWPYFTQTFGNFPVRSLRSPAMEAFLKKIGHEQGRR